MRGQNLGNYRTRYAPNTVYLLSPSLKRDMGYLTLRWICRKRAIRGKISSAEELLTVWRRSKPHRVVRACGAENKPLKRKSPQKRLQSVSESLRLFVPIGFVPVVECSTIPITTYAERKTGALIDYSLLNRIIHDTYKQWKSRFTHYLENERSVELELYMVIGCACTAVSHYRKR